MTDVQMVIASVIDLLEAKGILTDDERKRIRSSIGSFRPATEFVDAVNLIINADR